MKITETAFYKYLLKLNLEQRTYHLMQCGLNGGEMYYELAEHFDEFNPIELAKMVETPSLPVAP